LERLAEIAPARQDLQRRANPLDRLAGGLQGRQIGSGSALEPGRIVKRDVMNEISEPTIALLQRRRSVAPVNLTGPGPTERELETALRIASRAPDHGKLAPWRFLVFEGAARERAGRLALEIKLADEPLLDEASRQIELGRFSRSPLVVGVISRAAPHVKIPEWEQVLSAGAACMELVIAVNALGYASTWLTEWCAYDARFRAAIGLAEHERIVGFVHVGRPKFAPEDRPRPALADVVARFPA
jgi:nitroreductase